MNTMSFTLLFIGTSWLIFLTVWLILISRRKNKSQGFGASSLWSWSLVKFNPFAEVGGEHSFVITLLDGTKSGVILTGLHGRGLTRFYVKQVDFGKPDQKLSDEETEGLKKALAKL
jgi:Protein of unknown function (DUF4446)